jgi:hypothetical protein
MKRFNHARVSVHVAGEAVGEKKAATSVNSHCLVRTSRWNRL